MSQLLPKASFLVSNPLRRPQVEQAYIVALKLLSHKQKLFVENYDGNATDAARKAGYSGNNRHLICQGGKNLRLPHIRTTLDLKNDVANYFHVTTSFQLQQFWSQMIRLDDIVGRELMKELKAVDEPCIRAGDSTEDNPVWVLPSRDYKLKILGAIHTRQSDAMDKLAKSKRMFADVGGTELSPITINYSLSINELGENGKSPTQPSIEVEVQKGKQ